MHNQRHLLARARAGIATTAASAAAGAGTAAAFAAVAASPAAAPAAPPAVSRAAGPRPVQGATLTAYSAPARTYTVRAGDTLSGIAARFGMSWHALARANHLANPNLIHPGQVLAISGISGTAGQRADGDGDHDGDRTDAPAPAPAQQASTAGSGVGGWFGACVRSRESGGNYQAWNPAGYYGAYQFSRSTWVAYGGNPADYGHASPAEQDQVFANALAAGGRSNWAPYDGC